MFCIKECWCHVPISCFFLWWWCFSPPRFVMFWSLVFSMQWRLPSVLFGASVLLSVFSVFLCDVFSVVFSCLCFIVQHAQTCFWKRAKKKMCPFETCSRNQGTGQRNIFNLEPQAAIYKWLFQLDDSQSLHRKWLFHQTSIFKWLFGVPGCTRSSAQRLTFVYSDVATVDVFFTAAAQTRGVNLCVKQA